MKSISLLPLLFFYYSSFLIAQESYFPPNNSDEWETIDPAELGWCSDQIAELVTFLDEKNTKGFIVLKNGKIAIEHYFDDFTQDSIWYWASAGKTLTGFLVGMAEEQGLLNINDPTSDYLGNGWTNAPEEKENLITIKHQMTMCTGLDEGPESNWNCLDSDCLNYLEDAGTRWFYHNAPYRLLQDVIAEASGLNFNLYTQGLKNAIGMKGIWSNYIYYSRPRDAARFGLLMLNQGTWNGNQVLDHPDFLESMTQPSQEFNESYGYLTWLNGQASHMLPAFSLVYDGVLIPNAPPDMYAALGKNDQKIHVVPSMDLVVIRMGDNSGISLFAASPFDSEIWTYLNNIFCNTTSTSSSFLEEEVAISPNPFHSNLYIRSAEKVSLKIIDNVGNLHLVQTVQNTNINTENLPKGIFYIQIENEEGRILKTEKIVKM